MFNIDVFIQRYSFHPGYVIKAKYRELPSPLDHYIVYLGKMYFPDADGTARLQHVFAANLYPNGTQFIGEHRAMQLLKKYYPAEVQACYRNQPCNPSVTARRAIRIAQCSQEQYNLLWNNCQDFVQQATTGQKVRYQQDNFVV